MIPGLPRAYDSVVLGYPRAVLALLCLLLAFFGYHARSFELDASAESLLLEDDQDLKLFRQVHERYPGQDFLVVTFTPEEDLFADASRAQLERLRDGLREIDGVDSVTSILDIPLLKNRDMSLIEAAMNFQRLEEPDVDLDRAREEILQSPVFADLILSADARTTAVLVNLTEEPEYSRLLKERNDLREQNRAGALDADGRERLARASEAYDRVHRALNEQRHRIVGDIRAFMAPFEDSATLHLGGVPMITDDMMTFVRNDLVVFGAGVLVFLVVVLTVIFGELRWIVLPLLSCFYAGLVMIGMLGLVGWKVTVISSNFLALMLIITISMNIHLIVRYKQLCTELRDGAQRDLVSLAACKMARPCLYTALTTIMGFSSLVVSEIKPVIDFGLMMSAGLTVTFATSFLLFPTVLVLLRKSDPQTDRGREFRLPGLLAALTERHGGKILALALVLAVGSAIGVSRLRVENSFINYFSDSTEIYQGLKLIDRQLGGTTPLEIILNLDEGVLEELQELEEEIDESTLSAEELADLEFERELALEIANSPEYWFTPYKIERIKAAHDYLAAQPEVGKVLSLASVVRVGEDLHEGEFDSLELTLLYKRAPEEFKETMIDPYVSIPNQEARIVLRIRDSEEDLRRKELLERIERDLTGKLEFEPEDVTVTGLLVLYNNMLQSLFKSQISTLGVVMLGIAIMFLVLFRSVTLSVIGIVPNLMGALVVLGMMGWLDVPLDMMTITIAAIAIGIAVDNGIHYIYRFREELAQNGDYVATLHLCHASIGKAVLYTTATIIFGFSILVLSNFIPTIYFGLLTALAMLIALLAALTLLPKLILAWRPFGADGAAPA